MHFHIYSHCWRDSVPCDYSAAHFLGTVSQGSLLASRDHPHSLALSPPPTASKTATMGCVFVTFQMYLTISSASSVCAHFSDSLAFLLCC